MSIHSIMTPRRRCLLLLPVFVFVALGCSGGRDAADVSGQVTFKGEPEEGIYVYFQPTVASGGDAMNVGTSSYGVHG